MNLSKPKIQKQSEENIIKSVRNLFILKKKEIKDRIIGNIKILFQREDDYYKLKRVSKFWNNDSVEYGSNGDRYKNLSLQDYLNKIKPNLRDKIVIFKNLIHGKFS